LARIALHYGDFRPIRPDESGYSKSKRLYISKSTGEVITRYRFQTEAKGGINPAKHAKLQKEREEKGIVKPKKPRKPRSDKGKPRGPKKEKKAPPGVKKVPPGPKKKKKEHYKDGYERFNDARKHYNKQRGVSPEDHTISDAEFYDNYYIISHPDEFSKKEVNDAWDYLDMTDDRDEYIEGDTP